MTTQRHPSQADWPDDHDEIVKRAVRDLGTWPKELSSGRMFYMGDRITREEFNKARQDAREGEMG